MLGQNLRVLQILTHKAEIARVFFLPRWTNLFSGGSKVLSQGDLYDIWPHTWDNFWRA